MISTRVALLLLGALFLGTAPVHADTARLEAVLDAKTLRGARVAALVVDASGGTVFARNADMPLIPASNQKVLTALAALHALGPTHGFVTELWSDAEPDADGAVRNLYVRGTGDPTLTSEMLWRLAADLRRAGVRRIRGDLVLDDSAFDRERWHPSWGRTGARAYHAPVGALTVNYGAFGVTVAPGAESGEPLRVTIDPPVSYLALTQRGRTGPARSRTTLVVDRQPGAGAERVIVSGSVPAGRPAKTHRRSVLDPTGYFGAVLRMQLDALDIPVGGEVRRGFVPADARKVLDFEGRPLSQSIRLFMKYSNNQTGEALMKALDARTEDGPGDWKGGALAIREQLRSLSLPLDGLVLVDGSGLSYENRVSPRLLVAALRSAAADFAIAPEFVASLPLAGADGTLSDRADAADGRVRAKTGLLTRVTGLSGYALRADGERLTFSILVNGFRGSAQGAMDALDRFAEALAEP